MQSTRKFAKKLSMVKNFRFTVFVIANEKIKSSLQFLWVIEYKRYVDIKPNEL